MGAFCELFSDFKNKEFQFFLSSSVLTV